MEEVAKVAKSLLSKWLDDKTTWTKKEHKLYNDLYVEADCFYHESGHYDEDPYFDEDDISHDEFIYDELQGMVKGRGA